METLYRLSYRGNDVESYTGDLRFATRYLGWDPPCLARLPVRPSGGVIVCDHHAIEEMSAPEPIRLRGYVAGVGFEPT